MNIIIESKKPVKIIKNATSNIIKHKYKFDQSENILNFKHFQLCEKINSMCIKIRESQDLNTTFL